MYIHTYVLIVIDGWHIVTSYVVYVCNSLCEQPHVIHTLATKVSHRNYNKSKL